MARNVSDKYGPPDDLDSIELEEETITELRDWIESLSKLEQFQTGRTKTGIYGERIYPGAQAKIGDHLISVEFYPNERRLGINTGDGIIRTTVEAVVG